MLKLRHCLKTDHLGFLQTLNYLGLILNPLRFLLQFASPQVISKLNLLNLFQLHPNLGPYRLLNLHKTDKLDKPEVFAILRQLGVAN